MPVAFLVAREGWASFEAHRLGAAVPDELNHVRGKPLLLYRLIEEDREREVVATIADYWTGA